MCRNQHLILMETPLFSALFGHGTCEAVLVVADGSSGHLSFASLGTNPRLQRMSMFFAQEEPIQHLLGFSFAPTLFAQALYSSRIAANGLLAVTGNCTAVAFFLENREQRGEGGSGAGAASMQSCRLALPLRPPLFSCCTVPLPHDDGGDNGVGSAGGEKGDGGVGGGASSALVCVCGEGVRVAPIWYQPSTGTMSASAISSASNPTPLAAIALGAASALPLPSAVYEVHPVFLPASKSGGTARGSDSSSAQGRVSRDQECILLATSLRGSGPPLQPTRACRVANTCTCISAAVCGSCAVPHAHSWEPLTRCTCALTTGVRVENTQ